MERKLIQEYEVSSWDRVEYQPDEELKELEKKMADSALYCEAGECYDHAIPLDSL